MTNCGVCASSPRPSTRSKQRSPSSSARSPRSSLAEPGFGPLTAAKLVGEIAGADRFIWASDFPHNDAQYPGVVDELREHNGALAPEDRAGLFGLNALDLYGLPLPTTGAGQS